MGYIDVDLTGYVEPQVISDLSRTYKLKIVSVDEKEGVSGKKGTAYHTLDIICKILDAELDNPALIRKTLFLLTGSEDFDQKNRTQGSIIKFKKAIGDVGVDGKPTQGINTDNWINCEFEATLGLEHSDEFGDKNIVKRIVVPK